LHCSRVGSLFCLSADSASPAQKEADKLEADLEHSLRPNGWVDPIKVLPSKGRPVKDIVEQLKGFTAKEEAKVRVHPISR
jgi:excinuclease UvrABC helicase subunit UvrB